MNPEKPIALLPKWGGRCATALLVLTPLLLTPQVFEPYLVGKRVVVELCSLLFLFLWAHDRLTGHPSASWRTPLNACLLALLLVTGVSILGGWRNGGQLYRYRTLLTWIALGCTFVVLIRGGWRIDRVQRWLLIPCWLVAAIALLQHFGWRGPLNMQPAGPDWRFSIVSTLGNPNFVSGYLAILVPVVLIQGLYRSSSRFFWLAWLPGWLLILGTLLMTFTVGAWLALAVAALATGGLVLARRGLPLPAKSRLVTVLTASLLVGLWAFTDNPTNGFPRGNGVLDMAKASPRWRGGTAGRIFNWNVALSMIEENPVLGVGFGNFYGLNETYGGVVRERLGYVEHAPLHAGVDQPHQLPLELAAEAGPLGAFVAWWLPCVVVALAWRRLRREPERRLDLIPATLGVLVATVHGLVSFPTHLPASALAAVWCIAAIAAHPHPPSAPLPARRWALAPVGASLLAAGHLCSLPFRAEALAATVKTGFPPGFPEEGIARMSEKNIQIAERAAYLNPYNETIWMQLASARFAGADPVGAREALESSLALVERLYVHRSLKNAYLREGDVARAIHHLEAMTRLNSGHIPYWEDLLFLQQETGQPTGETKRCLQALREKSS